MKKDLTELVFILDKSGSMSGLEEDTIGGFNAMIRKQKKAPGEALVSAVLFSDDSDVIIDRVPLDEVKPLTEDDYFVGGCTALIDAIGGAIHHVQMIHKYIRKEDTPEHTMFVITTDGMENASHQYTSNQVKKMIKKQEKQGWEFLFLGANIDAVSTAANFGIRKEHAVNYHADQRGTQVNFEALSEAVTDLRTDGAIKENWRLKIDRDFKKRS